MVALFIKTTQTGLVACMTVASSAAVVSGPTTKVWMLKFFCTSETRLLRTSTKLGELGMAMRRVGAPVRAGGSTRTAAA